MLEPRPYLLENSVQNYQWGTRNDEAYIPKLIGNKAKEDIPYAEFWMGAHPSAPSRLIMDDKSQSLIEVLKSNPKEALGERVINKFGDSLPFLFKVLSAGNVLSIQTHPNKTQAIELHKADPEHYPDENHKPEIAIALGTFKALVGFKERDEFLNTINHYPVLKEFLNVNCDNESIENLFEKLISAFSPDDKESQRLVDSIKKQIEEETEFFELREEEILFVELYEKYKYDVGLIVLLLMRLVMLSEGEALYTPAGIPHAYVEGNIIECMANSDNVLRLGLTPKFKDIQNISKIIKFEPQALPRLTPVVNGNKKIYQSEAEEFRITKMSFNVNEKIIEENDGPAIIICTEGRCTIHSREGTELQLKRGASCFIPAILKTYEIVSNSDCILFRADVP